MFEIKFEFVFSINGNALKTTIVEVDKLVYGVCRAIFNSRI